LIAILLEVLLDYGDMIRGKFDMQGVVRSPAATGARRRAPREMFQGPGGSTPASARSMASSAYVSS